MIGLMKIEHQYIGRTWKESETGVYRTIINPYNQEEIAQVPESDRSDAKLAIKEARKAFDYGEWPKLPGAERGKTLHQIADLVEREREELARLETLDTGKTLVESRTDMSDIANVFRYYAELAGKETGEIIDSPIPNSISKVIREPVGVCGDRKSTRLNS